MELMELMDLIRDNVTVTAYDSKTVYIAKPKEDGWYYSNPFDVVFNTLVKNGIDFETKSFDYEDVFELDNELVIIIYEEEEED